MKMSKIIFAIVSVASMLIAFTENVFAGDKTVTYNTNRAFTELSVSSAIDVVWSETESSIVVSADESIIRNVVVENNYEKIKIYVKRCIFSYNHGRVRVILPSSANIREIELAGAVSFSSETAVTSGKLDIEISGASSFSAPVDVRGKLEVDCSGASAFKSDIFCSSLSLDLSGASSAHISGETGYADIELSGASSLMGIDKPLNTSDVECELSGASKARVNCFGVIRGTLSGASFIKYGTSSRGAYISVSGGSYASAE